MYPEKFAGFLWRAILTNKITKKEIREKFGISNSTLSRWLSGDNMPHKVLANLVRDEIGSVRWD